LNPSLLDHALKYSAVGLAIIPTFGKKAACPWKSFQNERPGPETVQGLFNKPDITGLAVVHGPVSGGLACRDFDELAAYDRWAADHVDLANSLPTVQTPRGRHVYFRGPEGFTKFEDGEYRGTPRQYTLLPPSRHPSGPTYRWLIPLPDGELPFVDPFQAGLGGKIEKMGESQRRCNTADTSNGGRTVSAVSAVLQGIERAIAATLPIMKGQRNQCVFRLAQHLKSILPDAEPAKLRVIVQEWYRRALPVIGTKEFVETWADFIQAWEKVRVPAGEGAVEMAFKLAVADPPPPIAVKLYGEGRPPIVLLATLCRELQRIAGDGEFFLDCRWAGRLIEVDHTTAWRYLKVLCADGVLAAGAKGSRTTGKASQFRFVG
jgi:hypothetical protein